MSSERSQENPAPTLDDEQKSVQFYKILYLGSAIIDSPSDKDKALSILSEFQRNHVMPNPEMQVTLTFPSQRNDSIKVFGMADEDSSQHSSGYGDAMPGDDAASMSAMSHTSNVTLGAPGKQVLKRQFPLCQIRIAVRGNQETARYMCFIYTDPASGHNSAQVFCCDNAEAVDKMMSHFKSLFASPNPEAPLLQSPTRANQCAVYLNVLLDVRELVANGTTFSPAPRNISTRTFKLLRDARRLIVVTVQQIRNTFDALPTNTAPPSNVLLSVDRLFVLLGAGHNLNYSDVTSLITDDAQGLTNPSLSTSTSTQSNNGQTLQNLQAASMPLSSKCQVCPWDPTAESNASQLNELNVVTPLDCKVLATVAIDIMSNSLTEPVRLPIEVTAKIQSPDTHHGAADNTWARQLRDLVSSGRSYDPLATRFRLDLKRSGDHPDRFDVIRCRNETTRTVVNIGMGTADDLHDADNGDVDDDDVAELDLPSGAGTVNREVNDSKLLANWQKAIVELEMTNKKVAPSVDTQSQLTSVTAQMSQRAKELPASVAKLIRRHGGVPESLRGVVWPALLGVIDDRHEFYLRMQQEQPPASSDADIEHDVSRTYSGHDKFNTQEGLDELRRVCRAYAAFDAELGYSQGMSFVAACLLTHMPEEQAFATLCGIFNKPLFARNLFVDKFKHLHCMFYQLERALEKRSPALFRHLTKHDVIPQLYASQWFLTLFTARFSLPFACRSLDLFLLEGPVALLKIALVMLMQNRQAIQSKEFEHIMLFFRSKLVMLYRTEDDVDALFNEVAKLNLKQKELASYEEQFNPEESLKHKQVALMRRLLDSDLSTLMQKDLINQLGEYQNIVRQKDELIAQLANEQNANHDTLRANTDTIQCTTNARQVLAKQLNALEKIVAECDGCSKRAEVSRHSNGDANGDVESNRVAKLEAEVRDAQTVLACTNTMLAEMSAQLDEKQRLLTDCQRELMDVQSRTSAMSQARSGASALANATSNAASKASKLFPALSSFTASGGAHTGPTSPPTSGNPKV